MRRAQPMKGNDEMNGRESANQGKASEKREMKKWIREKEMKCANIRRAFITLTLSDSHVAKNPVLHPHTRRVIFHPKIIKTTDLTYFRRLASFVICRHNDPWGNPTTQVLSSSTSTSSSIGLPVFFTRPLALGIGSGFAWIVSEPVPKWTRVWAYTACRRSRW